MTNKNQEQTHLVVVNNKGLTTGQQAFIKAYLSNDNYVNEAELKTFLKIINANGDYSQLEFGSHMMDRWKLWQAADQAMLQLEDLMDNNDSQKP